MTTPGHTSTVKSLTLVLTNPCRNGVLGVGGSDLLTIIWWWVANSGAKSWTPTSSWSVSRTHAVVCKVGRGWSKWPGLPLFMGFGSLLSHLHPSLIPQYETVQEQLLSSPGPERSLQSVPLSPSNKASPTPFLDLATCPGLCWPLGP